MFSLNAFNEPPFVNSKFNSIYTTLWVVLFASENPPCSR